MIVLPFLAFMFIGFSFSIILVVHEISFGILLICLPFSYLICFMISFFAFLICYITCIFISCCLYYFLLLDFFHYYTFFFRTSLLRYLHTFLKYLIFPYNICSSGILLLIPFCFSLISLTIFFNIFVNNLTDVVFVNHII